MLDNIINSNVMLNITQFFRTITPILAAIGTISSTVGFWRIFQKWNKPGIYSIIPFIRGWIFSKDSSYITRMLYSFSDGFIVVLTPIFYWIRIYGNIEEVVIKDFTFYIDRAMIIVVVLWAIAEIVKFISYTIVAKNLCIKNNKKKRWIFSWIFLPKFTKIIWGFSNKFIKKEEIEDIKESEVIENE